MEVKEPKKEASSYYPVKLRTELPVNLFLSRINTQDTSAEIPHIHARVYSKMHNTRLYPIGRFQKPISTIL